MTDNGTAVNPPPPVYQPEACCMCRWIVWNEDCGHGAGDGITSPHDHCPMHGGESDSDDR